MEKNKENKEKYYVYVPHSFFALIIKININLNQFALVSLTLDLKIPYFTK